MDQIKIVSDSSDVKHYEQEETKEVLGFTKTPAFCVSKIISKVNLADEYELRIA